MSARNFTLQPFARDLVFGEGLRWHDSRLWLSDMLARKVYAFTEDGTRELIAEVPGRPNGLAFLPDGRLVIASMADGRLLRRERSGELVEHANMSALMTGYSGDIAVDGVGRAYVDDVGYRVFEGAKFAPGRLILVQPSGESRVLEEGLAFPNGMWITRDRKRLIFAEGRAGRLFEYRLGADGNLAEKRLFAHLSDTVFDGLTLDEEDGVWACQPYAKRVIRLESGGRITHEIGFPDTKPVACCLGGMDLKTLYVVSADYTLERMATNDCWAVVHTARVEIPGFPLPG
jgi:sugar lactone lactonase YvrE